MKKILFAASTTSHIENFHIPYLKFFKSKGYEIHIIGKKNNKRPIPYVDKIIDIDFKKTMISPKNIFYSFKIAKIINSEDYSLIYTHTILASFFTRLGLLLSFNRNCTVINTVHGYLFDFNSSKLKKLVMISAEKLVRCVTDYVLVMNATDYKIAQKYNLYKRDLILINGMGFNSKCFPFIDVTEIHHLREKHNFSDADFILIYVAEFSKRKNQKFLVSALKSLVDQGYSNIKLLFLGDGALTNSIQQYVNNLNLNNNVIFKGYVALTSEYYKLSNVCVSSSRIEGLPFNIMEAMSTGLPVVASNIKGHIDLVKDKQNGFLYEYNNITEFCNYIKILYNNPDLLNEMSKKSRTISTKYCLDSVISKNQNILQSLIERH